MKFTILSHAGLLVENSAGKKLVCDPWLRGSSYWRSWWNYPPVSKELVNNLNPDVLYITHIHWDHFHGPSLNKFPKDIKILVPKGNYDRNKKDLVGLGFTNVHEMKHGETYEIDKNFTVTSYQFGIFLDSAPLIQCDKITLLNLNDSKHMGATLKQIVNKHKPIDFVFRSHSSANARMSYEFIDAKDEVVDDTEKYVRDFTATVRATGAKYAIPFASNHCHLHKDSWKYNNIVQTPQSVKEYFEKNNITSPELKVMVSGDSWDSVKGFEIADEDWFENRQNHLENYREANKEKLEAFYEQEDKTRLNKRMVDKYFSTLSEKLPFFLKRKFKDRWYTWVLYTHEKPAYIYNINLANGEVKEIDANENLDFDRYPLQIHTTAFIFKRSIAFQIFSHMSIGKRVFYKVRKKDKPKVELLNLIFNLEEYDMLPLKRVFSKRNLETWMLRYREILLYFNLLRDKLFYKKLNATKYLKPLEQQNE